MKRFPIASAAFSSAGTSGVPPSEQRPEAPRELGDRETPEDPSDDGDT